LSYASLDPIAGNYRHRIPRGQRPRAIHPR